MCENITPAVEKSQTREISVEWIDTAADWVQPTAHHSNLLKDGLTKYIHNSTKI